MFLLELIQKIKNFFLSLFFSSGEDFQNQKTMKALMAEVKRAKYPIYRLDNTILGGLPIIIYELFVAIQPLKCLFASTIASNDLRISEHFLDSIIEDVFTDEEKALRDKLSLDARTNEISDFLSIEFDKILKEQNKDFNDFFIALSDSKFKKINDTVNKCYAFFDFTNFRFNAFFAYFDPGFESIAESDIVKDRYNFESVAGLDVLQEILDMDFLLRNIVIDEDFVMGIFFLNSKLPEKVRRDENSIKRDLHNFSFIVENNLGRSTLKNLAKLIKKDPFFEDETVVDNNFFATEEYKKRLSAKFNSGTKKLLTMQQDAQLSSLIDKLFNGMEMIQLKLYNHQLNEKIQTLTTLALDWVKPLEIILTFTKRFFEPNFEAFLRELIVEGYFEDKKFQSVLASDYYFCESIPEKIKEFESLTNEKNEYSESHIKGFLARLEAGGDAEKSLAKIVDFLNMKAKGLVEDIAKHYVNLYKACSFIVADAHQSIPSYVSNLKAMIISTRNRDRFTSLEEGMKNFEFFLNIIKKYVIIETVEIKNSLRDI